MSALLYTVFWNFLDTNQRRVGQSTGLPWPASCSVVGSEHIETGPFGTDYVETIHLQMSPADAQSWINQPPFGGKAAWKTPVESIGLIDTDLVPKGLEHRRSIWVAESKANGEGATVVVDSASGDAWFQRWSE
ncbi:hypothetical protein [Aeoliella sp.]|uniref:hypothetical protein n=1 Tax=Aeoliella sp. TaxID=2795800 RepID=UPI003CCBA046